LRLNRIKQDYVEMTTNFKWDLGVRLKHQVKAGDVEAVADRLPKAVAYVQKHAVEGVTRADVAELIGCSQGHVSRLFSDVLGKHFKEFVLECRIDQAKELLVDTDDKIIDVAFYSGFEDPNYFGTCFKRLTGVTPGQSFYYP